MLQGLWNAHETWNKHMNKQIAGQAAHGQLTAIGARLELGRVRLEERFLEGGDVLARTLEQLNVMIGALDEVAGTLDKASVEATTSRLAQTADQLVGVPTLQLGRNASLRDLSGTASVLAAQLADMTVIIRYLRSFATTVKVTGAGADGFDVFANEMLGQIVAAKAQVESFAATLDELRGGLNTALHAGAEIDRNYNLLVPALAGDLARDAQAYAAYQIEIAQVAGELKDVVRKVQLGMARALSALQVGDITRQRVEHVQAGITLLESAPDLSSGERSSFLRLLAAQAEDLQNEFHQGCISVSSALSGLAADSKEILSLGRRARGDASSGSGTFLRSLETSVGAAREMVDQVEAAGERSQAVCRSSADAARTLAGSVDAIRSIRTEIQHMAINTSLRCNRMGEAGKPINVVASELGSFAAQLESLSELLLATLKELEGKADALIAAGSVSLTLSTDLEAALSDIRDAGARSAGGLREIALKGDQIAGDVARSVARLDFSRELGEFFEECSLMLEEEAASLAEEDEAGEPSDALLALQESLRARYTMAREREVHARHHFAGGQSAVSEAGLAAGGAEADLDEALFF
jgi:hypothetical protein